MAAFGSGGFGNQSSFGQSSSAFGGGAFGSNSGPFGGGQSAFGSQSNSLFGSQPQSFSAFGQSASFGGSSFGAQSAPAFGSGFGSQSGSTFGSGFGAQSSSGFGASGAFGSGSSLFGANRPPTGGFGSSNPFGQSQSAWSQSSSAFGGSSTFGSGGGLFGNSGPSNSVFGQGTAAFGSSAQGQNGTAGASWQITTEYDAGQGQAPSKYHSITMMNQFRGKSMEELRVEDYASGHKAGSQAGSGGGFGNPQSGGLFGNTGSGFGGQTGGFGSTSAFGNTGGFGQSSGAGGFGGGTFGASSGFGQQSGGGFGGGASFGAQSGQSGGGIFGQSSSGFGAQSSGGFGSTGNTGFGSSSGFGGNPQSGGLFGSGGGAFGGTQQQSQPGFGSSNTQPGLFGSSFQATGNNAFGSSGPQTGSSLFGGNTGQQSLFGGAASGLNNAGNQKPLFGSTGGGAFANNSFGATVPGNTGGVSFGGLNSVQGAANAFGFGGSGFGQQPAQQVQVPGGFGSSVVPGQAYGVIGSGNNPSMQGTFAAVTQQHGTTVAPPGANYGTVLYNLQKLQSELGEHNKLLEKQSKTTAPATKPADTVSVVVLPPPSPFGYPGSAGGSSVSGHKWAGSRSQRTKMRGVAGRIGGPAARVSGTPIPSSPNQDIEHIPSTPARPSTEVVRRMSFFSPRNFSELRKSGTARPSELPSPIPSTPKMLPLPEGYERRTNERSEKQEREMAPLDGNDKGPQRQDRRVIENTVSKLTDSDNHTVSTKRGNKSPSERTPRNAPKDQENNSAMRANGEPPADSRTNNATKRKSQSKSDDGSNDVNFVWAQQRPSSWSLNRPVDSDDQYNPHKYLPSQTRSGFYTVPSMAELASQTMAELQQVEKFTVGREGYGEITWVDPVDVRGLNLDAVVDIQRGEVAVYPEKEAEQLDAPARVKLEGMFAKRKRAGESLSDEELSKRYTQKLRNYCSRNDLQFIDYDPVKGEWSFKVQTFAD